MRLLHQSIQTAGAIEQRVLGVEMEMNKIRVRHAANLMPDKRGGKRRENNIITNCSLANERANRTGASSVKFWLSNGEPSNSALKLQLVQLLVNAVLYDEIRHVCPSQRCVLDP
jgi:hypothetical protein